MFNDFKDKGKEYDKAMRKANSDKKQSASTWTIKTLARYVTKEDVHFKPSPNEEEIKDLYSQHRVLIHKIDEKIYLATSCHYPKLLTECEVRIMVLDVILQNICILKKDLKIVNELTIKCDSLPTNKPDYVLFCKDRPRG